MTEAKQKVVTRILIEIDEDLCTGCGNCARVIFEIFCNRVEKIIERETLEFDEEAVEIYLESLKNMLLVKFVEKPSEFLISGYDFLLLILILSAVSIITVISRIMKSFIKKK